MKKSFVALNVALTLPLILGFSDSNKTFVVETNAYVTAMGAVIPQEQEEEKPHQFQYANRTVTLVEQIY